VEGSELFASESIDRNASKVLERKGGTLRLEVIDDLDDRGDDEGTYLVSLVFMIFVVA